MMPQTGVSHSKTSARHSFLSSTDLISHCDTQGTECSVVATNAESYLVDSIRGIFRFVEYHRLPSQLELDVPQRFGSRGRRQGIEFGIQVSCCPRWLYDQRRKSSGRCCGSSNHCGLGSRGKGKLTKRAGGRPRLPSLSHGIVTVVHIAFSRLTMTRGERYLRRGWLEGRWKRVCGCGWWWWWWWWV